MGNTGIVLTVYFEEPFWVGVFERTRDGRLSVCKVTFGAEPKDYEVHAYILENFRSLHFSPSVEVSVREPPKNPKRLQREAGRQMRPAGIGTKSQQALALQREQLGQERKTRTKAQREAEQQRLFELAQQKKKEKHKGH